MSRSGSAAALAATQIDFERHFLVRSRVPGQAMQFLTFDLGDGNPLPGEPLGCPRQAVAVKGGDGRESGEEQQVKIEQRANLHYRALLYLKPLSGICSLDYVGVAANNHTR